MVNVKSILKILAGIVLGLLLLALALFTLAGGWYSLPRQLHFRRVVKNTDFVAVTRSAAGVIRKSATEKVVYRGNTMTNLPKSIAELKPEFVLVYGDHMVISFHGGAEDFGLWVQEMEDAWVIYSYPNRFPRPPIVSLTLSKDLKTGEPDGEANRSQPVGSETNRPPATAGSGR